MARFGRVITAMVTPFREDGSLDIDEAQRLARHLVDKGCEGLVVCGSTGESATLTHTEKVDLFRGVKDAVAGDGCVIAGSGTYSTADSIDLTREAEKAGADGVLVVTPYYNRPPQDALLNHFRMVADSSNLPVMVYDIPARTATKIDVGTLLRAAEHPRIVALKDAGNDLGATGRFAAAKPDDFEIYSGDDNQTLCYQALGAVGVVSVTAHVMAPQLVEQIAAFERNDIAKAREIQLLEVRVHPALCTANPIPIKAAVRMIGFKVGAPRPPLRDVTPEEEANVREALETLGVL